MGQPKKENPWDCAGRHNHRITVRSVVHRWTMTSARRPAVTRAMKVTWHQNLIVISSSKNGIVTKILEPVDLLNASVSNQLNRRLLFGGIVFDDNYALKWFWQNSRFLFLWIPASALDWTWQCQILTTSIWNYRNSKCHRRMKLLFMSRAIWTLPNNWQQPTEPLTAVRRFIINDFVSLGTTKRTRNSIVTMTFDSLVNYPHKSRIYWLDTFGLTWLVLVFQSILTRPGAWWWPNCGSK